MLDCVAIIVDVNLVLCGAFRLLVLMGVMMMLLQQQNCEISFNRAPNYY
jgi:hypothetical protein